MVGTQENRYKGTASGVLSRSKSSLEDPSSSRSTQRHTAQCDTSSISRISDETCAPGTPTPSLRQQAGASDTPRLTNMYPERVLKRTSTIPDSRHKLRFEHACDMSDRCAQGHSCIQQTGAPSDGAALLLSADHLLLSCGLAPDCAFLCAPRPYSSHRNVPGKKLLDLIMRRHGHPNTHWEQLIAQRLGNRWMVCRHATMNEMHLTVYSLEHNLMGIGKCITNIDFARSACGVGGIVGNKGALVVKLQFRDTSLAFMSCHLAAHSHRLAQRNENCQEVLRETRAVGIKELDVATQFDHVFLFGDLNYRIDLNHRIRMLSSVVSGANNSMTDAAVESGVASAIHKVESSIEAGLHEAKHIVTEHIVPTLSKLHASSKHAFADSSRSIFPTKKAAEEGAAKPSRTKSPLSSLGTFLKRDVLSLLRKGEGSRKGEDSRKREGGPSCSGEGEQPTDEPKDEPSCSCDTDQLKDKPSCSGDTEPEPLVKKPSLLELGPLSMGECSSLETARKEERAAAANRRKTTSDASYSSRRSEFDAAFAEKPPFFRRSQSLPADFSDSEGMYVYSATLLQSLQSHSACT